MLPAAVGHHCSFCHCVSVSGLPLPTKLCGLLCPLAKHSSMQLKCHRNFISLFISCGPVESHEPLHWPWYIGLKEPVCNPWGNIIFWKCLSNCANKLQHVTFFTRYRYKSYLFGLIYTHARPASSLPSGLASLPRLGEEVEVLCRGGDWKADCGGENITSHVYT